jgi:hypothetical protein
MQFNELDVAGMSAWELAQVFCIGDIHTFGYKLLVKVLQRQDVREAIVRDGGLCDPRERDLLVRAAKEAGYTVTRKIKRQGQTLPTIVGFRKLRRKP